MVLVLTVYCTMVCVHMLYCYYNVIYDIAFLLDLQSAKLNA